MNTTPIELHPLIQPYWPYLLKSICKVNNINHYVNYMLTKSGYVSFIILSKSFYIIIERDFITNNNIYWNSINSSEHFWKDFIELNNLLSPQWTLQKNIFEESEKTILKRYSFDNHWVNLPNAFKYLK